MGDVYEVVVGVVSDVFAEGLYGPVQVCFDVQSGIAQGEVYSFMDG